MFLLGNFHSAFIRAYTDSMLISGVDALDDMAMYCMM